MVGSCVIVTHSQGGNFGFTAARQAPEKVKAVIAVEPSGAPDPEKMDVNRVTSVPHLFVWGDYLDTHPVWVQAVQAAARYRDALAEAGGIADWLELPHAGIHGNSHLLMIDTNSDGVAQRIQQWLSQRQLMRSV